MQKIRIITKGQGIIERRATITDYLDNQGRMYSIAMIGCFKYQIFASDAEGKLWKYCGSSRKVKG
jgi:hypothetical protein